MRTFIAIDLPEGVKEGIFEVSSKLPAKGLTLVKKGAIHITLHFLGEVGEADAARLGDILKSAIKLKPFNVSLTGLGYFTPQEPRVIFVNVVDGRDAIISAYEQLSEPLSHEGFRVERNYVPHVTIARIKQGTQRQPVTSLVSKYANTNFGGFSVNSIKMKKSTLTKEGPVYEDLQEFDL